MKPVEDYCKKALEIGIDDARVIDPRSVVTAHWVRMKCQFGCPGYGNSHCCPPHTPTPDLTRKVIDSYEKAIVLHRRLKGGKEGRVSMELFYESKSRSFLTVTIRLGVWDQAHADFVRSVT